MKRLLTFLLCSTILFGDSSGPTSGTGAGSGWTTPTNVSASDNAYATRPIAGSFSTGDGEPGSSTPLSISSLGFSIPTAATVTGIEATIEHKCSGATSCYTSTLQLTKTANTGQGTSLGSATFWGTSDATEVLGSSTNLWGATWTGTEVNATGFGLTVTVSNSNGNTRTASIDYMALTVYYSPSGSGSHRRVIISQTRSFQIHG